LGRKIRKFSGRIPHGKYLIAKPAIWGEYKCQKKRAGCGAGVGGRKGREWLGMLFFLNSGSIGSSNINITHGSL